MHKLLRLYLPSVVIVSVAYFAISLLVPVIPAPPAVAESFIELIVAGYRGTSLAQHIFASLQRLMTALLAASAVALLIVLVIYRSLAVSEIVSAWVNFVKSIPPLSYYVLLVAISGIGNGPKVTLLAIAAFAPIFIPLFNSVRFTPEKYLETFQVRKTREWKVLVFIRLPYALPFFMTGLRLGSGFAFTTLVASEMVAATNGLGWLVLDASRYLRFDIVISGIVILGGLGLALDSFLGVFERRAYSWLRDS